MQQDSLQSLWVRVGFITLYNYLFLRERKNLKSSQIALRRPSLNKKLETKLLHHFRNGVTEVEFNYHY